ncbi:MAG: putative zinc-binding protein [Methanomassiliicoccales archaeon]|jgi:uncharacterized metal-binding protein|nr:putative zinc-binding protein [Methanomassiliicoccales archaeon]
MLNVVICGGYSPGARVLRAAIRNVAQSGEIKVITLCPALAGYEKQAEELRALDPASTVVVDGCEGGCGNQGLAKFGIKAKSVAVLDKYPMVSERNIKSAEERIRSFVKEAQA